MEIVEFGAFSFSFLLFFVRDFPSLEAFVVHAIIIGSYSVSVVKLSKMFVETQFRVQFTAISVDRQDLVVFVDFGEIVGILGKA